MGFLRGATKGSCALILCVACTGLCLADAGPFAPVPSLPEAATSIDHPLSRYRALSLPDCVDATSMVAEHSAGPRNVTYMRVEHMGDPGTGELEQEIAHPIAWPLSFYTGFAPGAGSQRGYLDRFGNSGFQLECAAAGFFINTATFAHEVPIAGEGPNVSVGRDFDPGFAVFERGDSLLLEADLSVPTLGTAIPPATSGTAQVSFYLYYHDRTRPAAIAQLVGMLDNRVPGLNGSGVEDTGNDNHTYFVASPLDAIDGLGARVEFVTPVPGSALMQYERGWSAARHFAVAISPANFAAALRRLVAAGADISRDPADYIVTAFGVLGEVFPGTTRDHEVALGASVSNLALRAIPARVFARP